MTHPLHPARRRLASGLLSVATVVAFSPASSIAAPVAGPWPTARTAAAGEAPESGADVGAVPAVQWHSCGDADSSEQQCATYAVPLDYQHPGEGTVQLAVNRLPATGPDRIGSLFLNPGGPGGSGVDVVAAVADAPS